MPPRLGRPRPRIAAPPRKAESFYLSAPWRAYRKAHRAWTVAREGGLWCAVCGAKGGKRGLILDHKIERRDGGEDFPPFAEAQWLCSGCHNAKTARAKAARVARHMRGGGQKSKG